MAEVVAMEVGYHDESVLEVQMRKERELNEINNLELLNQKRDNLKTSREFIPPLSTSQLDSSLS
jgi:hypothetical protein